MISFKGIDPAVLIHALYRGTQPLGMGVIHNQPGLTVDQVRDELKAEIESARAGRELLRFDYFHGRPLKVSLDLSLEEFNPRLYDRDAGQGSAQRIIDGLRAKAA